MPSRETRRATCLTGLWQIVVFLILQSHFLEDVERHAEVVLQSTIEDLVFPSKATLNATNPSCAPTESPTIVPVTNLTSPPAGAPTAPTEAPTAAPVPDPTTPPTVAPTIAPNPESSAEPINKVPVPYLFDPTRDPLDCSLISPNVILDAPKIELHIIAWKRPNALRGMLRQLMDAEYPVGSSVPLYFHLDGGYDAEVLEICNNFQWKHGPKVVDKRSENVGLRQMWLTSLGQSAKKMSPENLKNTLMVCLEDDMQLSPHYYQWLLGLIHRYARTPDCRDGNLMGFSLSPIKLEELQKPFSRWQARKAMGNDNEHLVYLSAVPSSWGAAYWADRWLEFDEFMAIRGEPQFYDYTQEQNMKGITDYDQLQLTPSMLQIPNSRSNVWPKSWKRFLIDYMYGRGLVVMYPSLKEERGLATTMALAGEHVGLKHVKANPRIAELVVQRETPWDPESEGHFPKYSAMRVFDLHLNPSDKESLFWNGAEFLRQVYKECGDDCEALMKAWGGIGPDTWITKRSKSLVCVADVYSPKPPSGNELGGSERYLVYEPQYGGNNQIFGLVEALIWSRILSRRLVVPPIFLPRASAFKESGNVMELLQHPMMDDAFNIVTSVSIGSTGNAMLPPISYADFLKKKVTPRRFIEVGNEAKFDESSFHMIQSLANQANHPIAFIDLRHQFGSNQFNGEDLRELLGGCDDDVLALDGLFLTSRVGKTIETGAMTKILEASPTLQKLLSFLESKLQAQMSTNEADASSYVCMHVRMGDFEHGCASFDQIPHYARLLSRNLTCVTEPESLLTAMHQLSKPVLLLSDNPDKVKALVQDKVNVPIVPSDWVEGQIETYLNASLPGQNTKEHIAFYSLLLEQELCGRSETAVLNSFSTVSKRIRLIRDSLDKEPETTNYWSKGGMQSDQYVPPKKKKTKKKRKAKRTT